MHVGDNNNNNNNNNNTNNNNNNDFGDEQVGDDYCENEEGDDAWFIFLFLKVFEIFVY